MALTRRINRSGLGLSTRLDAEHYSPRFLPVLEELRKNRTVKLRRSLLEPVRTGHTPSTKNAAYYSGGTVKFIKTDNLREDRIDTYDVHLLSELGHTQIAASELRPDDVIVTIIGATEDVIARAARVHGDLGRANINQNIALIRSSIPSGYLTTFLNTRYGREQLIWLSRQTGQVNLNCREVEEVEIPLLSEGFVRTICSLNTARHARLHDSDDTYIQAERSLLSEFGLLDWKPPNSLTYVGKYSDAAGAHRIDAEHFHPKFQAMFDRLREGVHLDPLHRLLVTLVKSIEVGSAAYTDSGVPFWRVSDLSKHGLDDSSVNYIKEEVYQALQGEYEPKQGEVLLSKDATPGIAYHLEAPIRGIVSGGILRLVLADGILPQYLELVLNSPFVQLQIEQAAGGSVIKHWKPSDVQNTLIPRLSSEKEAEIGALVQKAHTTRGEAKALLGVAKQAVELAVEQGEEVASAFVSGLP